MKLRVICIGRLKEAFFREASAEYEKRLTRYCEPSIVELPDEKVEREPSPSEVERVKKLECERLLSRISPQDYVIALDPKGKELSSEALADTLNGIMVGGTGSIAFLIGGSHGLTDEVRKRADLVLSFSKLTFPHQLFRVMLLEQVYRAFKIMSGEPYHK